MIVVDTNVIAYLYLPSSNSQAARAAFAADSAWSAPLLWRSEFRNVLVQYVRQEQLDAATAQEIQAAAEGLLAGREYAVDSHVGLELATSSGRSAYDCEFVAVAQALDVPLLTLDRQLLSSFPDVTLSLASFAE